VYALGTILFELLAGRLPFVAQDPGEYIVLHMQETPPPLASLVPACPPPLHTLIDSMLDKNPERRPAMSAVLRLLRELSTSMGEQASMELDLRKADALRTPIATPSTFEVATAVTQEAAFVPGPGAAAGAGLGRGAARGSGDEKVVHRSSTSLSATSTPSLGERVFGRLRDAGRRSWVRQREVGEELWSLLVRRGKKRRIVSAFVAACLIFAGLLGPFFLGRSSVRRDPPDPEPARPTPAAPVAAPAPVATDRRTQPAPSPPPPPLPASVRTVLFESEAQARAGETAEAMKTLRVALAREPHPQLWSALGQLACRRTKLSVANQALARLPATADDAQAATQPASQWARSELLSTCKAYDILENKAGKLVKVERPRSSSLRIRPVR
jgi:hypothetical protein